MQYYIDIESNEIISDEQLYKEYLQFGNEYNSFEDYKKNSMTWNNGTLQPINERK